MTLQDIFSDWASSHPFEHRLYKAELEKYGSKALIRWLPLIARWME